MKKVILFLLITLVLIFATGCNRSARYGDLSDEEIKQVEAAQEVIETGIIPDAWLHTEENEITYNEIKYTVGNLSLVNELPENLKKQFDKNHSDVPLTKYHHFLILNLTITNTCNTKKEILLEPRINSISDGKRSDVSEAIVFDKHQHPYGHDYRLYEFMPNEIMTSDFVFTAHEKDLVGDIYFTPNLYSCEFVKVMDAPFEAQVKAENADLEIWDEIFDKIKDNNATEDCLHPPVMPKPEKGTLKKSDVNVTSESELTFVIKNMEKDDAIKYFETLIFEGYNRTPFYIDNKGAEFASPTFDNENKTVSIIATYFSFIHDIVYTEDTKEFRVNICTFDKAFANSGAVINK